ncbi:MAG TPA: tetratricopeptide repeat protein [Candidatus Eisenbacteria bacterium]|nr:tetratricopeptide repeat protein [Candidatus Eisenbacteria bacterium]
MSRSEKRSLPPGFPNPEHETEKILLDRLRESTTGDDYFRWLLFAVGFYRGMQKNDSAKALLQLFMQSSDNPEQNAQCHLALGQIATDENRLETALNHFSAALELKPEKKTTAYVLLNNIGYCLNGLGRYLEAEQYCRRALEVDCTRSSAYRNLGLSLEGQGQLPAAAWALVEALGVDPADAKARDALKKLIALHPALIVECPWSLEGLMTSAHAGTCAQ